MLPEAYYRPLGVAAQVRGHIEQRCDWSSELCPSANRIFAPCLYLPLIAGSGSDCRSPSQGLPSQLGPTGFVIPHVYGFVFEFLRTMWTLYRGNLNTTQLLRTTSMPVVGSMLSETGSRRTEPSGGQETNQIQPRAF